MRDVGNDAAPVILAALDKEQDAATRHWLMRTFERLSHPAAIGPAQTWLTSGDKLAQTYAIYVLQSVARAAHEDAVRVKALDAIASACSLADEEIRRLAARTLSRVRSSHTDTLMIAALDNPDVQVQDRAARYLVAGEHATLTDFLSAAADKPSKTRYLAARAIVRDLETFAHSSKGDLPTMDFATFGTDSDAQQQFSVTIGAWLTWAKEQPTVSERFFSRDR